MCSRDDFSTPIIDVGGAIKIEIRKLLEPCDRAMNASSDFLLRIVEIRDCECRKNFCAGKFDHSACVRENFFANAVR